MINILYTLIIFPIEQVIEICFFYCKTWFGSLGVAILGVSVAVSTFVLPVYLMAERQQHRQREIEKSLKSGVELIKSVFRGDERFMLLSTYYRQNNYHPIFALRNSLDLLIQMPFFIAAYHFLHNLEVLKGASFLFIHDLGSPDKLLFGLNILPIAMTVINVVSVMIYAYDKDLTARDKIQLYLMAGIFLALLYNSPAGLVIYWTSNNIYNLVKNVIQKSLKNKEQAERKDVTISVEIKDNALNDCRTFILALLAVTLLMGLVIPSGVISSGVDEFSYSTAGELVSPLRFVIHTILQASGFLLWGICLYFLFQGKTRIILTIAVVSLLIMSVMDTFVYWKGNGFLTQELSLSNYQKPRSNQQNISLLVIIALSTAAFFLMKIRRKQIVISILFITVISFTAFGITDIVKTNTTFADMRRQKIGENSNRQTDTLETVFKFSKNGKNIIILMMDRAQSQHIPFIFEEKPFLKESFQGFTYYPNMVSFGGHTFYAAPALFGGYYYTPMEIQKRSEELLKDKYDKSLQVIPRMMAKNGFDVSVANLPFIDESEAFAKQIFADADKIEVADIIDKYIDSYYRGRLKATNSAIKTKDYDPIIKKNLFQFSLFKCSPYAMRTKVYNKGGYMNADVGDRSFVGNYSREMLKNYLSLLNYPKMTKITDDDRNVCVVADNDLVHAPSFLQYPDYEPVTVLTNKGNGVFADDPLYHVTMLGFLLISKWLDYLKENGVWDNTRIIIMSDHGSDEVTCNNIPVNITLPNGGKLQRFNNLLMVKDFGSAKELSVDSAFMTSADVPTIVTKDIIEDPVDPFTSKPFYIDKDTGIIIPTTTWMRLLGHGGYKYNFKDNEWLKVKENVFKRENWSEYLIEK
jgi:YidC/Oxa1 family membrane protein insertase